MGLGNWEQMSVAGGREGGETMGDEAGGVGWDPSHSALHGRHVLHGRGHVWHGKVALLGCFLKIFI